MGFESRGCVHKAQRSAVPRTLNVKTNKGTHNIEEHVLLQYCNACWAHTLYDIIFEDAEIAIPDCCAICSQREMIFHVFKIFIPINKESE